ncbi:hypothetical protein Bca52824_017930 [Brassica carinata]|uniref:Uncharacterized protein n=1 Tax=Brassica carinata TaxID=52824 RepID=A0A8X7VMZ4_BRACI|nr:hypothetical protein Bca52824_017930 [Brassica carinata]
MGRFRRSNGGGDTGSSRGDSRWLGALTNSNSEINQRMGSVEKELTLVIQILNRLESHVLGDKEKGIASSPPSQSKVPITHSQNEPGSEELGVDRYFRAARYDEQQKLEFISLSLIRAVGNCMFCQMLAEKAPPPRLHISPQELAEYKRLKLCFQCKAKWFKGHICGKPELQVYTVINGVEVELISEYEEEETEIQQVQESQLMHLSLYSFLGMDSPTTIKVRGKIGNTSLVILIDSSPNHVNTLELTSAVGHMNYGTWVGDLQQCSITNARLGITRMEFRVE